MGIYVTGGALALTIALHVILFGTHTENSYLRVLQQLRANFGYAPTMALLIFGCARYQNGIVRVFSGKWIVMGGEISYSIYLLHAIVINAFRYEAPKITSWEIAIGAYAQLTVVLAAILGLSVVSWRFIEVPCRRFVRATMSIQQPLKSKQPAFGVTQSRTR